MSKCILIRGPLGIGKTSVAKSLSQKLSAIHISIDDILEENKLDNIPEGSPGIPLENFIKANDIALNQANKGFQENKNIIFDGNFYHKEQLEDLEQRIRCKVEIFDLKASLKKCIERDAQRKKPHGEGAAIAVFNMVSSFEAGTKINTENQELETTVQTILQHLKK